MDSLRKRKLRKFFSDPLNISWIVLGVLLIVFLVFFDYYRKHFLKTSLIGIFFMMFFWLDGVIFRPASERLRYFAKSDPFAKKWKMFPVFLVEVYLAYLVASLMYYWLGRHITPDMVHRWYVIPWLIVMFGFYWHKTRKER